MPPEHADHLLLVYVAYVVAVASPGPSNMAIMGTAMSRGRASAVVMALGVMTDDGPAAHAGRTAPRPKQERAGP